MKYVLGIDPGVKGAIVILGQEGADVFDMPIEPSTRGGKARTDIDGYHLGTLIGNLNADQNISKAVVELVSSRPGQSGQFQFGMNCGIVLGVLYANSIPIQFVSASQWKPAMGLRRGVGSKTQSKSDSRTLATQLFPDLAPYFKRTQDDGRAEALLLACYGAPHLVPKKGGIFD